MPRPAARARAQVCFAAPRAVPAKAWRGWAPHKRHALYRAAAARGTPTTEGAGNAAPTTPVISAQPARSADGQQGAELHQADAVMADSATGISAVQLAVVNNLYADATPAIRDELRGDLLSRLASSGGLEDERTAKKAREM